MSVHHRKVTAIVSKLVEWFSKHARDLPWRRTRDPYAIWVSEVMLQQTQVTTVLRYWERWMRALPDVRALAAARPERLHKLWEGLGYYSRVRNMHKAAGLIVKEYDGNFPQRFEDVLALPGVGRYTAGAICSIAFNRPTPVLDGNVVRVLARVFGVGGNPRERRTNERLWALAEELVKLAAQRPSQSDRSDPPTPRVRRARRSDDRRCGDLNQALMELGALVCTSRQPRCDSCPLAQCCTALQQQRVAELPVPATRPRTMRRRFVAVVLESQGKFLVRRRPAETVNAHLWEFPNDEVPLGASALQRAARLLGGNGALKLSPLCTIVHSITRYRIKLEAFRAEFPSATKPQPKADLAADYPARRSRNQSLRYLRCLLCNSPFTEGNEGNEGKREFARPAMNFMDSSTDDADTPFDARHPRNPRLKTLRTKPTQNEIGRKAHSESERWLRPSQLRRLPFASAHRRILKLMTSQLA